MPKPTHKISTPQQAHLVTNPSQYRSQAVTAGRAVGTFSEVTDMTAVPRSAFINSGRWICVCDCGNAPSADPAWVMALCFECGKEWAPTFPLPTTLDAIEAVLVQRPIQNRNWLPEQTVEDLQAENDAAGIVPPVDEDDA